MYEQEVGEILWNITSSGNDSHCTHELRAVVLPEQDLIKIKPIYTSMDGTGNHEVSHLTEELLVVNGFQGRKSQFS